MNIKVNGRHVEVTDPIRKYAEEKIGKFDKYFSDSTEALVTLSVQKHVQIAEVQIKGNGQFVQAESSTDELYASIDDVVEKLDRQIKKSKGKKSDKRKGERARGGKSAPESAPLEAAEEGAAIIEREQRFVKPMPPEEAASRLEAEGLGFFVFTNAETEQFAVMYKRKDGNFGLIEPSSK